MDVIILRLFGKGISQHLNQIKYSDGLIDNLFPYCPLNVSQRKTVKQYNIEKHKRRKKENQPGKKISAAYLYTKKHKL
jgi:hypothetical protein